MVTRPLADSAALLIDSFNFSSSVLLSFEKGLLGIEVTLSGSEPHEPMALS